MGISSRKAGLALVSAVATLALVGFPPAPAAGAVGACGKTYFSAEGYDTDSEAKAAGAAHFGWEKAVRASSYGAAYASWSRAQHKSESCKKTGKYYTCKVTAQPCP